MKKQEKFIFFLLLLIILGLRIYHIDVPPLEIEESWRQADTESMAWNFANYDFNPWRPNLNYDGPLPNIPALEFQVTTYLIAVLYKIFGHHYLLARLVPLSFFMVSAIYLYLLARIYLEWRGAAWSLLIYGILPVNVYYSRAIMPEAAALMFWIGGFYYFNLWVSQRDHSRRLQQLILSSIFLSLAIMTKPPTAFIAIPMFYLCFKYFGWKWLKIPQLWLYALGTLAIPALYYYYSAQIAEYKFTVGITRDIILQKALTAFYSQEALNFFSQNIPRTTGLIGILLVFTGLFFISRKQMVLVVWFMAMLLELIIIVSPIRASYYLIFFTVPCALLGGNLLDKIRFNPTGKIMSMILVFALFLESYYQVTPMFRINPIIRNQWQVIEAVTKRDDLLVVGTLDPCLLSLSDRRGWRFNLRIYADTPRDPLAELSWYIEQGAKYFVPVQGKIYGDDNEEIMQTIRRKYSKIEPIEGYPIYQLD